MWKALQTMTKNLVFFIPLSLFLGFIFGLFFDLSFLKNFILFFTFLMVFPMMVGVNFKKLKEAGDYKVILTAQFLNFFIIPFVAFYLGKAFFGHHYYLTLGLLLSGLVPTSGMTISWTSFAKGNVEAAIKMTVIGLLFGSLATPFYVSFLMSTYLKIDVLYIFKQIVFIVLLPMFAGYLTQQSLLKRLGKDGFQKRVIPKLSGISTLGVLGIVFISMALKAKEICANYWILGQIFIPIFIFYGINFALATLIGKIIFTRTDAIALVYGTVMRNLSICLAIAIMTFGKTAPEVALVIALSFIVQVQSAAWYVKFSNRIFGKA